MNWFDRLTASFAPRWTLRRVVAREALRNGGGQPSRGYRNGRGDANALVLREGPELRRAARQLQRENGYARRAKRVLQGDIAGAWGAMPTAVSDDEGVVALVEQVWKAWSESTDCDADEATNFAGLQKLVVGSWSVDGAVLIRRRWRRLTDGYALPLQLQVLEIDHLDRSKTGTTPNGNRVVGGIEFNGRGKRVAYWLFPEHPESSLFASQSSERILARDIIHVREVERPGQVDGLTQFPSAIATLKDLDTFEDGELVRQGVAASFAAFITDPDGERESIVQGQTPTGAPQRELDEIQPGAIVHLKAGEEVMFPTPPTTSQADFALRNLRRAGAGIGVTYENLTGDYQNFSFSSARMARLVSQRQIESWQYTLFEPQFLRVVWRWAMEAAVFAQLVAVEVAAEWTHQPLPMIDPEAEIAASKAAVRAGLSTPDEEVRGRGHSPGSFWRRYADNFKKLDALGITLDSDPRKMSGAGQAQVTPVKTADDDSGDNTKRPAE